MPTTEKTSTSESSHYTRNADGGSQQRAMAIMPRPNGAAIESGNVWDALVSELGCPDLAQLVLQESEKYLKD